MQGFSQPRAFRIPLAIVCSTRQPLGMNHSHRPKIPTPFIHERYWLWDHKDAIHLVGA